MCVGKRAFSKRNAIDHAHNQRMRLPVARRGTASFSIAITCIMGYTWEIGQHSISHAWQEYACVYYFIVKEDWGCMHVDIIFPLTSETDLSKVGETFIK